MELTQQVKNFKNTAMFSQNFKPCLKSENKDTLAHEKALQALSNGYYVQYEETLRVVRNDGNRGPRLPPRVTQKHPGYIRNETGGLFTS